jgi:UDPglucose--hexose-1-phosphate uridylyltransferase
MDNQAQTRYNFISGHSVIFAPKRKKRPSDTSKKKSDNSCPFNPKTLKKSLILDQVPDTGAWQSAAIKNIFPALSTKNKKAYGYQEVLIDTNKHILNFAELSIKQIKNLLVLFQKRSNKLAKDKKINYILCFKNQGKAAGASLQHIHSQIFASAILPPDIIEERNRIALYQSENKTCPYCEMSKNEAIGPRLIWQDKNFIAFCPFASQYPYEAWLVSRRHVDNIGLLKSAELSSLAKALKLISTKLSALTYDFNFFIHDDISNLHQHFYLKIQPRPNVWAGVELGSGLIINPVFPETAAKYYK